MSKNERHTYRLPRPYPVRAFLRGWGLKKPIASIPSAIIGESPEKGLLPQPLGMAGPFAKYISDIRRTLVSPNIMRFQQKGVIGGFIDARLEKRFIKRLLG